MDHVFDIILNHKNTFLINKEGNGKGYKCQK